MFVPSQLAAADYSGVDAIFSKHCLDCHASQDPEGKLVLDDFETLMIGGESGAAIVPGKSAESLLMKMIEGGFERAGKKKMMPPGKRAKLSPAEIATIKTWIDAGAKAPTAARPKEIVTPKIKPTVDPRRAINALAYSPEIKLLAVARHGEVELWSPDARSITRTLGGHRGNVSAVVFSGDGKHLFAAAGEPGLFGEVRQWNVPDGKLIRTIEGHKDAVYSLALSPDGRTLATGSYDQKIRLWNVADGAGIRTLHGHNGCVFDLAFRPDGKILASASADRTVKLWDVTTGERRDTLAQPLQAQHALAFSPDGKRLFAGGADNRIRIWQISDGAAETSNPILDATYAHEGAILNLVFSKDGKTLLTSADDRTVKVWDVDGLKERALIEKQPDWSPGLAFAAGATFVVGRLDGSLGLYDAKDGKLVPPPKPDLTRAEPRGLQRGTTTNVRLTGSNLVALIEVKFQNTNLTGRILNSVSERTNTAWIEITAASALARGSHEFSVANPGGESGKLKLHVDELPNLSEEEGGRNAKVPFSFWGALDPAGDTDEIQFEAKAGQSLVCEVSAQSLGSKASLNLAILDAKGSVVAASTGFDGGDPLLAFKATTTGRYTARLSDEVASGSREHFYRLSVGEFPEVVAVYPLSVPTNSESEVELIGFNLPMSSKVRVKSGKAGELEVAIDPEKFHARRTFKVAVADQPELFETEPNDTPAQATRITPPCSVAGRIRQASPTDLDLFRFDTTKGRTWIIETSAARHGSPIDTKIEVLHADGRPVDRLLLQAVRNTAINFRGIDSSGGGARLDNYEEMELNELLYLKGEVNKFFRMPQGPDSDMSFYTSGGRRRAYFDTSATAHALEEQGYVVQPHPPGTKLVANGLPVFTLYYANDDDGERKLGADSKLQFTAPADGGYLVRVADTRNHGDDRFAYRLIVREPKPDFTVSLSGANPIVPRGSGQNFSVNAERLDGFEDAIQVEITGLPPGFTVSTPLVIEAGHTSASGTLHARLDAPPPDGTNNPISKITAAAIIHGKSVTKEVNNLGKITPGPAPKLWVHLGPYSESDTNHFNPTNAPTRPLELTINPGETIPAWLKVHRNGHDDLITFTVENLPHGVIVDNIGLSGVLIPKDESERQIFIAAAKWVQEMDRLCYAVENQAGRQTSRPVMLHVRKRSGANASAGAK